MNSINHYRCFSKCECIYRFNCSSQVTRVIYHPEEDLVITASPDTTIRVWNVGTSQTTLLLKAHDAPVTGLSLHPTGDYLLSSSLDQHWAFSDIRTGRLLTKVRDDVSNTHTEYSGSAEYSYELNVRSRLAWRCPDKRDSLWLRRSSIRTVWSSALAQLTPRWRSGIWRNSQMWRTSRVTRARSRPSVSRKTDTTWRQPRKTRASNSGTCANWRTSRLCS